MDYWDEVLGCDGVELPRARSLTKDEIETLWRLFASIASHWGRASNVDLLRSRWLDMIEARSAVEERQRAFIDASNVFAALETARPGDHLKIIFTETIVTMETAEMTRLQHTKLFVVNDFIKCFVMMGGFRGFVREGRNYAAFLGGSRAREWPPVRTGART